MFKFFVVLTVFASPANVADNAPLTIQPETSIEFRNTTEKNTEADCARVAKALKTSGKLAFCGDVNEIDDAL